MSAVTPPPRILITGANRGLGLEFVRQLSGRGATVLAACREPARALDLHALADRHPGRVEPLPLDVADAGAIAALGRRLDAEGRALDWLINNAGVLPSGERFGAIDADALATTLRVNTIAPLLLAQALVPVLRRGQAPRVANISSILGSVAACDAFNTPSYRISKCGLNMVTALLAQALGADGIKVVALHPGWVRTDMGGADAEIEAPVSVAGLLAVIDALDEAVHGAFLDYRGEPVPW